MFVCRHAEKKKKMLENPQAERNVEDEKVNILSPRSTKRRRLEDVYSTLHNLCTNEEAELHSKETILEMGKKQPDEKHLSWLLTVSIH